MYIEWNIDSVIKTLQGFYGALHKFDVQQLTQHLALVDKANIQVKSGYYAMNSNEGKFMQQTMFFLGQGDTLLITGAFLLGFFLVAIAPHLELECVLEHFLLDMEGTKIELCMLQILHSVSLLP